MLSFDRWFCFLFFFNDTATTEIYTLSLHDALPILPSSARAVCHRRPGIPICVVEPAFEPFRKCSDGSITIGNRRSEKMQMIRHGNSSQDRPSIQLVKDVATNPPRIVIVENSFPLRHAKCDEIDSALLPRQPTWDARWPTHDFRL